MPKGVIQDWGLVEFFNPKDSEATQAKLNGHVLRGHPIKVHFCIPGVNAINIYMQVRKFNFFWCKCETEHAFVFEQRESED